MSMHGARYVLDWWNGWRLCTYLLLMQHTVDQLQVCDDMGQVAFQRNLAFNYCTLVADLWVRNCLNVWFFTWPPGKMVPHVHGHSRSRPQVELMGFCLLSLSPFFLIEGASFSSFLTTRAHATSLDAISCLFLPSCHRVTGSYHSLMPSLLYRSPWTPT